jgi:hypothetical protein
MLLLLDLPWQVALAAMTGCAADVVGGVTLHKVLQIGAPSKVGNILSGRSRKRGEQLGKLDVLIVDEARQGGSAGRAVLVA